MSSALPALFGLVLLLAGVAMALLRARHRRRAWRPRAMEALASCSSLIDMLGALQQHRGLSTGWLAGDASFAPRMHARRREIDALMPALMRAAEHESDNIRPCFTVNDASLFRHRWRELVDGLADSLANPTPEQNIATHTRQIERLTGMIAALGEARIELPGASDLPAGLAKNFAYRLPALSECLGQARAIGSGAAAAGHCAPVARVRLMFLVARAESLLRQAIEIDGGQASGLLARRHVDRLSTMVRTGLLAGSRTGVSAEIYFETATDAIDSVFGWIQASADALRQALIDDDSVRAGQGAFRPM